MCKLHWILFIKYISVIAATMNGTNEEMALNTSAPRPRASNEIIQTITDHTCACIQNCTHLVCSVDDNFDGTLQTLSNHEYNKFSRLDLSFLELKAPLTKLDIKPLVNFTNMIQLLMHRAPGVINIGEIQILPEENTFSGCKNLQELRINIPLTDARMPISLSAITEPLTQLKILDLNGVRNIGWQRLIKITQWITGNLSQLILSNFQTVTSLAYQSELKPMDLFNYARHSNPPQFKRLIEIDLSNNGFQNVRAGWYRSVPNLKFLDLSNNLLTQSQAISFFAEMFMQPSIEVLNISNQLDAVNTNAERIYMNTRKDQSNKADNVPTQLYKSIKIHKPKMPFSILSCINEKTKGNISALFDKSQASYCSFMRFCLHAYFNDMRCTYLPDLYSMVNTDCGYWMEIPLGSNIREIDLDNVQAFPITGNMSSMYGNTLCFANSSVRKLTLSANPLWWTRFAEMPSVFMNNQISVRGLDRLEEIDLSSNNIYFDIDRSKINFPAVKSLNLSGNANLKLNLQTSFCNNKGLQKLTKLDLSGTKLMVSTPTIYDNAVGFITGCSNLEELHLAKTNFGSSFVLNLGGADNLHFIDLSSNDLEFINEKFASTLDAAPNADNLTIDLTNNPLSCGCSKNSLNFVNWIKHTKVKIFNLTELKCSGVDGQDHLSHVDYFTLWYKCYHIQPVVITLAAFLCIGFVITVTMVIYRRRFRLLHFFFRCQQRACNLRNNDDGMREIYEYDAFVSYSSEDRFWVHDVLMKTLEDKYGFRLVIHYRDIQLGANIQRAIDAFLTKSREFIIVMSENFLESSWCEMEMEEAYRESLRRNSTIAVIILGEKPTNVSNPTARFILETHNYLEWSVDESSITDHESISKQTLFWSKLVDHLYGGKNTCPCCCIRFGPRVIGYPDVVRYAQNNESTHEAEQQETEDDDDVSLIQDGDESMEDDSIPLLSISTQNDDLPSDISGTSSQEIPDYNAHRI